MGLGVNQDTKLAPMLAALAKSGACGRTCMSGACLALHAKNRLHAKQAAVGLQAIINGMTYQCYFDLSLEIFLL